MARSRKRPPLVAFAAIAAAALTTRASLADHYRVPSGSMEPTVQIGDHIVANKAAYGLRVPLTSDWLVRYAEPRRGDVVIIDDGSERPVLLKRVVAVGGDLVEIKDGHVYLEGAEVREPNASVELGGGPDFGPARVPAHRVLVLGDNRGNSRDGRSFGWVDRDRVIGRAFAVVARGGELTYEPL